MVITVEKKDLDRINYLYKKSQAEGLTEEERAEQKALREAYVRAVHNNLKGALENISIQNPDGSVTALKDLKKKTKE